jgi:drug/metabolite transporter (DMT)-like permease
MQRDRKRKSGMIKNTNGLLNGLAGVAIFSGSLPATRIAVLKLDPIFLTSARAAVAALLAICLLLLLREKRPSRAEMLPLFVVAIGVVLGFPLLTAFALQYVTSAHSIVMIGLLPLATAIFGVMRGGERPAPAFWLFAIIGSLLVMGFAASHGISGISKGDGLMLAAVILCGLGYAEGARLSRHLGGWQVISWALVIALPVMLPLSLFYWPADTGSVTTDAWLALGYVTVFSMLVGFIFWYRGLAQGGTASVGQLQLLQPFLGLLIAAFLLGEPVSLAMLAVTAGVVLCVALARRFA